MIIFDGIYRLHRGPRNRRSAEKTGGDAWRLRIIDLSMGRPGVRHLRPIIVVASPETGGIFFTSCAECLGTRICRDFALQAKGILWIESHFQGAARMDVAIFEPGTAAGHTPVYKVAWRPIRPNELDAIRPYIPEVETLDDD